MISSIAIERENVQLLTSVRLNWRLQETLENCRNSNNHSTARCQWESVRNLSSYKLAESTWLYHVVGSTFNLLSAKSASSATVLNRFTDELVNFLLLIRLFARTDYQWSLPSRTSTCTRLRYFVPVRCLVIYCPYCRKSGFRPSRESRKF